MTSVSRPVTLALVGAGILALAAAAAVSLHADQIVVTNDVQVTGGGPPPGLNLPGIVGAGPQQPLPAGSGLILGQTVDAAGSRPLGGVLVTLVLPGSTPIRVLSDGQGRFVFRSLPKGAYNISGSRNGYADGATGRMRPGGPGQPVALADGERASNVTVPLWKYAAIDGLITDESGEPAVGVTVRVLRRQIVSGKPKLSMGAADQTDDRGYFRIGSLEPGEYIVSVPMTQQGAVQGMLDRLTRGGEISDVLTTANVSFAQASTSAASADAGRDGGPAGRAADGRPLVYPTQFYPNAAAASRGTVVALGSGDERAGVDFQLRPSRAMKVSGVAMGPEGPAANLALSLVPAEADGVISPIETATAVSDATGNFAFATIPVGQYVLRAFRAPRMANETLSVTTNNGQVMIARYVVSSNGAPPPLPTDPTLWAEQPVTVGADDVTGLAVTLRGGLKVGGQVEFSGGAARPAATDLQNIGVSLEAADAGALAAAQAIQGRVESSGQFATVAAPPGRYFVKASRAPQGWFFRGATLNGRDVTDTPLELESADVGNIALVFSDRQAEVDGTVMTNAAAADPTAAVIVFPAERESWQNYGASPRRLRNVRTDAKGAFSVRGLPPGRYYIAAVRDAVASEWQDPAFLESLVTGATSIDVADGQKVTQSLKVVR